MQTRKAFYAGLNGALAMTVLVGLIPFPLLPQNLGLILGSLLVRDVSLAAWAIGLLLHLMVGGVVAVGYAAFFERVLHASGWLQGAALGLLQAVLAGPLLALLPLVHPLVPEVLPPPGVYLTELGGLGVFAFFATHCLYGIVVGGVYADLPVPAPRRASGELN